jgi:hypothetical protein
LIEGIMTGFISGEVMEENLDFGEVLLECGTEVVAWTRTSFLAALAGRTRTGV